MKIKLYKEDSPAYEWQTTLHNYISDYLQDIKTEKFYKIIVVKAGRQLYGKTHLAIAELLRFSFSKSNSRCGYISYSLNLATEVFTKIKNACGDYIEKSNGKDLIIQFNNGSIIRFFSAKQDTSLRGFNCSDLLILDECSFISDISWTEVISPWVLKHKPLVLMFSTPKYKSGFFWNNFSDGLKEDNKITKTFDWSNDFPHDVDENPFLQKMREDMPSKKFRCEFLGEWLDAEGNVFGNFEHCIFPEGYIPPFKSLYFGLDFGTGCGKDFTVLTALNEKGEQCFLYCVNDLSPVEQTKKIIDIIKKFQKLENVSVKGILAEENSIGKIYLDMFRAAGLNLTRFKTANLSKRKLVESLQVAFENSNIFILNDKKQIDELEFYESKVTQHNNIQYNAPSNMHDDRVMGLMLAYECYKRNKNNMKNRVSFI